MTPTPCRAVTTPTPTGVAVQCSCGWRAAWHRLGPWPDGLPLRQPAQLQLQASRAVAAHLRRHRRGAATLLA